MKSFKFQILSSGFLCHQFCQKMDFLDFIFQIQFYHALLVSSVRLINLNYFYINVKVQSLDYFDQVDCSSLNLYWDCLFKSY